MYLVVFYVGEYVWVCGCVGVCVYTKSKNFRTLSAPSEIASLREAISSSPAFEKFIMQSGPCESKLLMVKKYLLVYFQSLFSNRTH
jgi:hypothetical protein